MNDKQATKGFYTNRVNDNCCDHCNNSRDCLPFLPRANFSYLGANLPFNTSPKQGNSFYNLRFTAAPSASAYTIQAVPTGGQTADRCGIMTINQNNQRTPANDCW